MRAAIGVVLGILAIASAWKALDRSANRRQSEAPVTPPPEGSVTRQFSDPRTHQSGSPRSVNESPIDRKQANGFDDADGDRITFRVSPVTLLLALMAVVVAGTTLTRSSANATLASLTAWTQNDGGFLQAGSIRLSAEPNEIPAFAVPAMLPGESIDRVFAISQGGSTDASLVLGVIPVSGGRLALDRDAGLQLDISRCVAGSWIAVNAPSTPPAFECVGSNPSLSASVTSIYQGPLVAHVHTADTGPSAIPVVDRVGPGQQVSIRVRASLPVGASDWAQQPATSSADRAAAVTLEWRALPVTANLSGGTLATPVAVPVQSTPPPTAVPSVIPATPFPAAATPFPMPSATAEPVMGIQPAGYSGYALALDGVGDEIELGGSPASLANRDAWTVEAWVRPDDFSGPQAIYTENVPIANGAAGMVLGVGLMDRRIVVGGWSDASTANWAWTEAEVPSDIAPGTWFHVAAIRSGLNVAIMVNGNPLATTSTGGMTWSTLSTSVPSRFHVGRAANPGEASYFQGQIDDIRLWTVARTADAVRVARRQRLWGNEIGLGTYMPVSGFPISSVDGRGTAILNQVTGSYTGLLKGGVRFVASGAEITLPPTPYQLSLAQASDSGVQGDLLTNASVVSITGIADPGSVVTLYQNGAAVAPTVVTAHDGTFSASASLPSDSIYTFTATAQLGSGAMGLPSTGTQVRRDATPPSPPTIAVSLASTGESVTASGSSEVGTLLSLEIDGSVTYSTVSLGAWSYVYTAQFANGSHSVTIHSVDDAGNRSSSTSSFTVGPNYSAPIAATFTGALQNSSSASAEHSWTASQTGWLIVDTCGSAFDTVLTAFGIENDDGASAINCGLASLIRSQVVGGVTYSLRIRPYGANGGQYIIRLRYG